jgi:hypothetical protein
MWSAEQIEEKKLDFLLHPSQMEKWSHVTNLVSLEDDTCGSLHYFMQLVSV